MKVKECPSRKNCFDYKDNNCDNCDFGDEVKSLFYGVDLLDELGCIEFEIGLAELKKKYQEGEPNGKNIKE